MEIDETETKQFVLLVDDDPALRSIVGFSLENSGYSVVEVDSRERALEALTKKLFPAIILDMGMSPAEHSPQEGLAVLDWLRNNQPQTKTVVLTGQNADSTSYLALKHGAFDFLEKPISTSTLLQSLKRAILFFEQEQRLIEQEGVKKVQVEAYLGEGVKSIRNSAEEKLVKSVLADTEFNVHEAARRLGLKRENVYYLIKKYHIQREKLS